MRSFFMERRYMVVLSAIVTVVFVTSLVLPAFGAPSPLTLAKRALKTAKKANRTAATANRRSRQALAVANQPGPQGPAGPQGAQGPQGPQGVPGTARAYATITTAPGGPTVVTAKSTPGTTATRAAEGRWCVQFPGISSANFPAVATPVRGAHPISMNTVEVANTNSNCPAGRFEVATKNIQGNSGLGDYDDFVPFMIVVP